MPSLLDMGTIYSRPGPYRDAVAMQRVLRDIVKQKEGKPAELAACARSWDVLEDRKRELKGRPKSGQKRPAPEKPKASPETDGFDPGAT